jgi:hypothetical protein
MNRIIRLGAAAVLFISIFFLAQRGVAWANQPSGPSLSARESSGNSVVPAKDDDCEKEKGNNKNKDKNKCKGSVKPPKGNLVIPVTGDYSVGGFCTLSVVVNDPDTRLEATIQTPLPRELPDDVHKVRQGCRLTFFGSNQRLAALPAALGNAVICFAATPQKTMVLYFYDLEASNPVWAPLATTVQNGIACADANKTGVYVATFKNP